MTIALLYRQASGSGHTKEVDTAGVGPRPFNVALFNSSKSTFVPSLLHVRRILLYISTGTNPRPFNGAPLVALPFDVSTAAAAPSLFASPFVSDASVPLFVAMGLNDG